MSVLEELYVPKLKYLRGTLFVVSLFEPEGNK